MIEDKKKKFPWTIFNACAAALVYGLWAFYANSEYSFITSSRAAIIQGIYAFISTLLITHVAYKVFLHYKCGVKGVTTGFCVSFIVMLILPLSVHSAFQTPDIWQTILPGLIWGSMYLFFFLMSVDLKLRISQDNQQKIV